MLIRLKKLITITLLALIFFASSCMRLAPATVSDDEPGVRFGDLDGYDVFENRLTIGYVDREDLDNLIQNLHAEILLDIPELNAVSLKLPMPISKIYNKLREMKIDGIRYIEPNYKRELIQPESRNNHEDFALASIEGDPLRQYQWALNKLNAETVWETASGTGIIIAVIDSPVDGQHPDLKGQFVTGYDPYNGMEIAPDTDGDVAWELSDDHGTHVSGIIAATKDNNIGITGLAYNAKLMPVNIFAWQYGMMEYVGDEFVAQGIIWAVDHGADILSNSWGGSGYSILVKEAIDYALSNNVVFIASSGNNSFRSSSNYPAGYPGVIAIGASTVRDTVVDFSSWGEYMSVVAPGENILSCVPEYESPQYYQESGVQGEPYEYWDGTSMSCPYVSALAALILEKYPEATPYQVMKLMEMGTQDIETKGYDEKAGYGLIDPIASLALDPADYQDGFLSVKITDRSGKMSVPAAYVTLHREDGRNYYAKTNESGYANFYAIDRGTYDIYLGGSDYMDFNALNWRMEEERSKTIENVSVGDNTNITEAFKSDFGAYVNTLVDGDFTVEIVDREGTVYASTPFTRSAFIQFPELARGGLYYLVVDGYSPAFDELEPDYSDDFETGDFSNPDFNWNLGGNALPYIQSEVTESGTYSARFGEIGDMEQRSYFETTVDIAESSKLEFDFKVSSTPWLCSFRLFIDKNLAVEYDGEKDWTKVEIPLQPGTHTLSFEMYRIMSFGGYEETAWIDNITITKDLSIVNATVNINGIPVEVYGTLTGEKATLDELGGYGFWYTIF